MKWITTKLFAVLLAFSLTACTTLGTMPESNNEPTSKVEASPVDWQQIGYIALGAVAAVFVVDALLGCDATVDVPAGDGVTLEVDAC